MNLLGGAVAANGQECAEIGANILKQGGSAADAAISTMLCEGVTCPQSTGLGGGFLMTIYIKATGVVETLNAREVAPKRATQNMFVNNTKAALEGGLSIAVPGEVSKKFIYKFTSFNSYCVFILQIKGMWELHQKYGKLPWADLFTPVIDLCRKGHEVTVYLARILAFVETKILDQPSLREIFVDPKTNKTWVQGDKLKRLELANTMEVLAKEGADSVYKMGTIGKQLLQDIEDFGGIITAEDFADYKVTWEDPIESVMKNGEKLYTTPLPGSGPILAFIMNLLKDFELKNDALTWHRIVEAYKFGYAQRSNLGDPKFVEDAAALVKNLTSLTYADAIRKKIDDNRTSDDVNYYGAHFSSPDDHGTAHMCILAPNGDAVSVTGTVNYILGSMRRSKTGIILNDEMDDFSIPGEINAYGIPASPANYIVPGKQPMSSMTPSIIVGKDGVRMIIGSAGGSRITTAVIHAIIQNMFFDQTIRDAFSSKRLHHQLLPNKILYEPGFDDNIVNELIEKKHSMELVTSTVGFGALVGITKQNGNIDAAVDPRRGGSVVVF